MGHGTRRTMRTPPYPRTRARAEGLGEYLEDRTWWMGSERGAKID